MSSEQKSVADLLKEEQREKKKKERFIRTRMWMSTLSSLLHNDQGSIPPNIGNNMLVMNNMYVTKNALSSQILVIELSEETPVGFISEMIEEVKLHISDVVIDVTMKNKRYKVNLNDKGLQERIRTWNSTINRPHASPKMAKRAARLLFSVEVIKEKPKTYKTRMYITVRAKKGSSLASGVSEVCKYLDTIDARYKVIKSDLESHLEYITMLSDKTTKFIKSVPSTLQTDTTISQMLPQTQGMNDDDGTLLGIDRKGNVPYFENFKRVSLARNILVSGPSGYGKTFIVMNWLVDMLSTGYNSVMDDVKGTELGALCEAFNGKTISLRQDSKVFYNVFTWHADEALGVSLTEYVYNKIGLARRFLTICTGFKGQELLDTESLIDEFLKSLYLQVGAMPDNPKSWFRTADLNPYIVFEYLERFVSYDIRNKYPTVATKVVDRLRNKISRTGSSAQVFKESVELKDIMDSQVLRFDFGMSAGTTGYDPVLFELKFFFREVLTNMYIAYKKSIEQWTVCVMEESEIVDDFVLKSYTESIELRRAQNVVNIVLGNSIHALANNPISKPMLENIKMYVVAPTTKSGREYIQEEFGLSNGDMKDFDLITNDPTFSNTFLLINRLSVKATTALLKFTVPKSVRDSKLFKVVDYEK